MTRRLVLLRHARIAADRVGRLIGVTDLPLDAVGERQASALAERVGRWSPERCYASPMQRCRQTATAVFPGDICVDGGLREIDFGICEGRTFDEVARQDPALVQRWAAFGPDFAFPGGESVAGFIERVRGAAGRLARDEASTVLAVAHKGVIRAMLCHFLGLAPRQYVLFDVGYGAMAVLDLFEGKGVLASLERLEDGDG